MGLLDNLFGPDDGKDEPEVWQPIPPWEFTTDEQVYAEVGRCPTCGGPGDGTSCEWRC
jgi:hypothetical protein